MQKSFLPVILLALCSIKSTFGSSSSAQRTNNRNHDDNKKRNKTKTLRGETQRNLQLSLDRKNPPALNKKALKITRPKPPTGPSPTQPPAEDNIQDGALTCEDDPEFTYVAILHSGEKLDCNMFSIIGGSSMCEEYGDIVDRNGLTANQACCACGGQDNLVDDTCYDDPDFAQLGPSNPITGFALNCEAFARPELEGICGREGSRKDRNGLTANEACCGCGGSDNGIDDKCFDDPDFEPVGVLTDGTLMTCEAFERFFNLCEDFGTRTDVNGLSANESCCVCGGSDNGRTDECIDDPDFTDVGSPSFGEPMNCDAFAKYDNLCSDFGSSRRDYVSGLTANEACCACGGKTNGVDDTCDDNTDFLILQPEGFDDIVCRSFVYDGWCDLYGDWEDPNGLSANAVCCACTQQRRNRQLRVPAANALLSPKAPVRPREEEQ